MHAVFGHIFEIRNGHSKHNHAEVFCMISLSLTFVLRLFYKYSKYYKKLDNDGADASNTFAKN